MITDHAAASWAVTAIAIGLAAATLGCAADQRRFPLREPLRVDPDSTPFSPRPAKFVSPEIWDTIDNLAFEPLVHALSVKKIPRAINVNALDEVADSSWFENRVDSIAAQAEREASLEPWIRGSCTRPVPELAGPWTVIGGKPNGANPGFMVQHASGRRFLFKLDGGREGERPGAADVIGSRLYHLAGYFAPCNRIAFIDPATIQLSPTATAEDFVGDEIPFTRAMLDRALARGMRRSDGAIRGGLSELLDGKPIGPWTDFGTRPDDPNDVVPHEHRRELRGSYILAALLSHYDAREQNSLDVWISKGDGEPGFVRHYMLDFGDCLGSQSASPRVTRRRSHAYELEWSVAFTELLTLGLLPRPWRNPTYGPGGATLGYFAAEPFDPENFRTAYPYGPLSRVTEADAAWGARILARIPVAALAAVIAEARFSDPVVIDAVTRALLGRREQLLRRFLGRLSALDQPRIVAGSSTTGTGAGALLCVTDTWVVAGLGARDTRPLTARLGEVTLPTSTGAGAAESCAALPATPLGYQIVTLSSASSASSGRQRPLRVHLAGIAGNYRVVGLERR